MIEISVLSPPSEEWRAVPMHVAEGPSEVRHKDGWIVCTTCSDEYARLIAAAPDMLAALQDIVQRNEIQHWFDVSKAKAAIAKVHSVRE